MHGHTDMPSEECAPSLTKEVVYVTGFGPFGTVTENSTDLLVKGLRQMGVAGETLEVSVSAAEEAIPRIHRMLRGHVERHGGRALVIHLGLANEIQHPQVEAFAFNEASFAIADQRMAKPVKCCVTDGLPFGHCLNASLDVRDVTNTLRRKGFNCKVSHDPGRFVCNYAYFLSLQAQRWSEIPAVFVHMPNAMTMPIEEQLRFITVCGNCFASAPPIPRRTPPPAERN
eukprot:Polyplicarium_translucidae@DN2846_c0_g1_i4.p3